METKLRGCYSEPGWWLSRWREVTDSRYARGRDDRSGCLIGHDGGAGERGRGYRHYPDVRAG